MPRLLRRRHSIDLLRPAITAIAAIDPAVDAAIAAITTAANAATGATTVAATIATALIATSITAATAANPSAAAAKPAAKAAATQPAATMGSRSSYARRHNNWQLVNHLLPSRARHGSPS